MKISITGAGASCVAVVSNLIESISAHGNSCGLEQITLINRNDNFGTGIAYGTNENHHLFNSRTGKIGIVSGNKEHFFEWVSGNKNVWEALFPELAGIELSRDSFLPRRLFGMYLKDVMQQAEAKAQSMGIAIVKIKGDVEDITELQDKTIIKTNDGQLWESEKIILATGNAPTKRIPALESNPKYIPSYWPGADIENIPRGAPVTVIGTGLTAVDLLLTLQATNHHGKISLISSSGKFSDVHPEKSLPHYSRKILTVENAKAMGEAFTADVYHDFLVRELAAAQSERLDKRSVIDSLRTNGDVIKFWRMLSAGEQKKWDTSYGSWYSAMRFRMPPQSWEKIKHLFDAGQAAIIKARVDGSLQASDDSFIINCSGPSFQEDQLLQNIIRQGKMAVHPSGGIAADEHMFVKRLDGSSSNTIMAIGALRRGEDYEVNAIPEITQQAARLVQSLMKQKVK